MARALGELWTETELAAAITAAAGVVTKAADPVSARVLAAVRDSLGAGNAGDLESVMRQAFVDAFTAGAHVAAGQLPENTGPLSTTVSSAALSGPGWSTWQPGHPAAAALTANGGMRDMLDEVGVRIKELSGTTVDQLGNRIAEGLAVGDPVDKIGRGLRSLLGGNASRAEMIAHTETARAMTQASAAVYAANGIGQWTLVTSAGACPVCLNVEAGGPYGVDDQSAMPPLHPRCRCAISPVPGSVVLGAPTGNVSDWLGDALSALSDLLGDDAGGAAAADVGGDLVDDEVEGGDAGELDDAPDDGGEEDTDGGEEAGSEPASSGGAADLTTLADDDLAELLAEADDDTAERVLAELDRRDAADAAARTAETVTEPAPKLSAKAAREAELEAQWDAAIAAGEDVQESYARIYGVDPERMARDEAIASLRASGYSGRGFDELVRAAFRDYAEQARWDAEAETNGYFLNKAGEAAGIDGTSLFTGPESRARKYASRELLDYWQQHGRLTFDDFRASILGGAMRSASTAAWS